MDENTNGGENSTQERGFGEVAEREIPQEDALDSEDTQDEQVEDGSNESFGRNSAQTDDQEGEENTEDENQENNSQQPEKTEKGTKLDPNPKSAVHQQLANERRVRTQMEQVLASPELIARFMQEQYGITVDVSRRGQPAQQDGQQQPSTTSKKWTAKDFESLEDVAEKFNGLKEQFASEIAKRDEELKTLKGQLGGLSERGRYLRVADTMEGDVHTLRALPELTPGDPEFVPGLEDKIGALYHKLDFDEASGMYRGNYSMREIGLEFIEAARAAKKAGSQKAQTIVKDKTGGRIRTGGTNGKPTVSRDELPPAQSIAQGISRMFK